MINILEAGLDLSQRERNLETRCAHQIVLDIGNVMTRNAKCQNFQKLFLACTIKIVSKGVGERGGSNGVTRVINEVLSGRE